MAAIRKADPVKALNRKGVMMLLLVGAAFAAIAVFAVAASRKTLIDDQFCLSLQPLPVSTVVIADFSDAPLDSQAEAVRRAVFHERDVLPHYGKLTLLTVNAEGPYEPGEHLSRCSPLPVQDANILNHTPSAVRQQWDRNFGAPIDRAIAAMIKAPESDSSPIMEAVTAASWRADWSPTQARRRLVLISDLMQHGPDGSLYQGDAVGLARTTSAKGAPPDLTGVEVEIVVLRRPGHLAVQTEVAEPFWVAWFTVRGAASVRFQGEREPRRASTALLQILSPQQTRP